MTLLKTNELVGVTKRPSRRRSRSKKDSKADEQREMARLWLAGYSHDAIAERLGVDKATSVNFCKSAKVHQTLGWKVDPEFTDLDPPKKRARHFTK